MLSRRLAKATWVDPMLLAMNWGAALLMALGLGIVYWHATRDTGTYTRNAVTDAVTNPRDVVTYTRNTVTEAVTNPMDIVTYTRNTGMPQKILLHTHTQGVLFCDATRGAGIIWFFVMPHLASAVSSITGRERSMILLCQLVTMQASIQPANV